MSEVRMPTQKRSIEKKEKIIEKAKSMNRFYTPEQEKEYGVVGIKIEIIK